jgi:enoyl-CoA hydratase
LLSYQKDGPIAWATIDRPEKLNAMTREFWGELIETMEAAEADPDVRVLIFRGAGKCFSVGGDVAGFGELDGLLDRRRYVAEAIGALRAVERFIKPTIAAVHGYALGGGCELTLVCDIVIVDDSAQFGLPESRVGLVPGLGVVRGIAQLNMHWMKYLVFTGETIDAHEAKAAGLVNVITATGEHETRAEEIAHTIARRAPLALQVGKQVLHRHAEDGYGHAVEAITLLQQSADLAEGIEAFAQRREPRFRGR